MPVRSKIALPASREIRGISYSYGSDIGMSTVGAVGGGVLVAGAPPHATRSIATTENRMAARVADV